MFGLSFCSRGFRRHWRIYLGFFWGEGGLGVLTPHPLVSDVFYMQTGQTFFFNTHNIYFDPLTPSFSEILDSPLNFVKSTNSFQSVKMAFLAMAARWPVTA